MTKIILSSFVAFIVFFVLFYDATARHHKDRDFKRNTGVGKNSFQAKMPYEVLSVRAYFPRDLRWFSPKDLNVPGFHPPMDQRPAMMVVIVKIHIMVTIMGWILLLIPERISYLLQMDK